MWRVCVFCLTFRRGCLSPFPLSLPSLPEQEVLPCAEYYKRQGFPLKKIVAFGGNRGFTDLLVFNEDRKEVNGLLHVHLPDGPTAHFRISNMVLGQDIKVGCAGIHCLAAAWGRVGGQCF